MKTKLLSLSLLIVIYSIALISAADFTATTSTPTPLTKKVINTNFTIVPNGPPGKNVNILVSLPTKISDSKSNDLTLNPPYVLNFNDIPFGTIVGPVNINYNEGSIPATYQIGSFTVYANVTITETTNSSNTLTKTIPITFVNDFCSNGENGTDLSISSVDIKNNDGDDTNWVPLDAITVKVEVSNEGSDKIGSVIVELGIFDVNGKNIVNKLNNLNNKKIKLGSINDGDSKIATFKFNVPIDFKEQEYRLVVKAYSDSKGQKNLCTAHSSDFDNNYYQTIIGDRETDEENHLVIYNIITSPETAQCGDLVQVSADIANIGDTDYSDQVKITLFNRELGINQEKILKEDFDQGDISNVNFEFTIPQNATEKTYNLDFRVYYDYDKSDGTYDITSENVFTKSLVVKGNCLPTTPPTSFLIPPIITAELDSETPQAIAGKDILINVNVKNPNNQQITYTISVTGNSAWSEVQSIEPRTLTIPAGESRDATIALKINSDVKDVEKSFFIIATYGPNNEKTQQEVSLTITTSPSARGLDLIVQHLTENWFIYLIIVVNIVLIIAIIIVIRRMMIPRHSSI
ncbi:MAG: putative S-layer protein [Candidatus Pacearchaeota archaeon]